MSFSALLVVGVAVADPKNDIMTSDDEEGFRTKSTSKQPYWAQIWSHGPRDKLISEIHFSLFSIRHGRASDDDESKDNTKGGKLTTKSRNRKREVVRL